MDADWDEVSTIFSPPLRVPGAAASIGDPMAHPPVGHIPPPREAEPAVLLLLLLLLLLLHTTAAAAVTRRLDSTWDAIASLFVRGTSATLSSPIASRSSAGVWRLAVGSLDGTKVWTVVLILLPLNRSIISPLRPPAPSTSVVRSLLWPLIMSRNCSGLEALPYARVSTFPQFHSCPRPISLHDLSG